MPLNEEDGIVLTTAKYHEPTNTELMTPPKEVWEEPQTNGILVQIRIMGPLKPVQQQKLMKIIEDAITMTCQGTTAEYKVDAL
jgi:hypothetical protein